MEKRILAKFKVDKVQNLRLGRSIMLSASASDNQLIFSGNISMVVVDESAEKFEEGKEFYVEFQSAEC